MAIPEQYKQYLSPAQLMQLQLDEATAVGPKLTFEEWLKQNPQYGQPPGKNKNPTTEAAKSMAKDYAKTAVKDYLASYGDSSLASTPTQNAAWNANAMESTGAPMTLADPAAPSGSSTGITQAQAAQGLGGALQAYQGYQKWQDGDKWGGLLSMGTGAANMGGAAGYSGAGEVAPYGSAAMGAYNVGNTLFGDNNMTGEEKATRAQQQAALAVADMYTFGLATPVEGLARKAFGKEAGKLDKLDQKYNPVTRVIKGYLGGKDRDQMNRDAVRKQMLEQGFLDSNYKVALANGGAFDIGQDGTKNLYNVDLSTPEAERDLKIVAPLAQLLTGGDKKLGSDFSGYFTNAVRSGGDVLANAKEMYKKAGVNSWDQARAGLNQLREAGKLSAQEVAVYDQGLANIFGNKGLEAPLAQLSTAGQQALGKPSSVPAAASTPVPRPTPTSVKIPVAPTPLTKPAVQAVATPTPIKRVTFPTRGYSATGILGGK